MCRIVIADLGTSGVPAPVQVTCSESGQRAAVCSERTGEYAVFARPQPGARGGGAWQRCDAGHAMAVVWHAEADVIALLVGAAGRIDARAAAKAAQSLIRPKARLPPCLLCPVPAPAARRHWHSHGVPLQHDMSSRPGAGAAVW